MPSTIFKHATGMTTRYAGAIWSHRTQFLSCIAFVLTLNLTPPDNTWNRHVGEWLNIPAHVAPANAIVVLGGGAERLPKAISLFQDNFAPQLWYTGVTESELETSGYARQWAFAQAVDMGVPASAITMLATTSTWEDGQQIAAMAKERGFHSILVVTSWYHGRRALCSINHHLKDDSVQVYYQPAATPGIDPDNWWLTEAGGRIVTTELYKTIFYWGYYGLIPWVC